MTFRTKKEQKTVKTVLKNVYNIFPLPPSIYLPLYAIAVKFLGE